MPKVELYGDGERKALEVDTVTYDPILPKDDNHRKSAYATMRELKPMLEQQGVTTDAVWERIKDFYGVESRSEFTTDQWAVIAARLRAALDDARLLSTLAQTAFTKGETLCKENS